MSNSELRFSGKTALITGASSGIGRALALALAQEGADLVLVARDFERLGEVASQAMRHDKNEILVQPIDVSQPEAVERMAQAAERAFEGLDILINAAGVGVQGKVADSDPEAVASMVAINLYGPYLVTRACVPLMNMNGGGDVVFIGSVAGLKASPGFAMYSATKFGVRGLAKALRLELREQGIRVMTVNPGMTETNFFQAFGQAPVAPGDGQRLLHAHEVAKIMVEALAMPRQAAVNDINIRPSWQER